MTLLKPSKRQILLTNPARVLLLTAPDRQEDGLEMTETTASMDLSTETKGELEVLCEAID